ncbi:RNA polymerase sigma factor [Actinomadura madurae]|uniref:RNA polymerase sigma factor n=1 Tax=Actinomadura madurae TaxID=1993 RepID=UPI0020D23AC9|nr:RNA polymerase sigma factor [Actinomadura madurae]MCP9953811.1 RNA polymerase sigma factor [Actinomadura madurae]MCP9970563.1 RNA polymerase sigma factor [Actinomadura madurae]MCP9983037.1 RNA polymerase sigma factor [Actinomadura madurae]MCQ0005408.1 RNA polymerase sigma factor [Actinomadura madurae]MCQ0019278.1 RNA polymerase sigma factor [Actinomadura madurae]
MISPEEQAAVCVLFRAEAEGLFAFAWAALTQGDAETARDLVQQTFQAAILAWADLAVRDTEGQRRWLYRVLKNKAIDEWRKQRRVCPVDEVETDDPIDHDSLEVGRQVLCAAALQECWNLIAKMPSDRARVAHLCWGEGWTTREIADELGIAASTVRGHIMKARNELLLRVGPQVPFIDDPEEEGWGKGTAS